MAESLWLFGMLEPGLERGSGQVEELRAKVDQPDEGAQETDTDPEGFEVASGLAWFGLVP